MNNNITIYAYMHNDERYIKQNETYLSENFRVGFMGQEHEFSGDNVLLFDNLELPHTSGEKLLEFANFLEAYTLGYLNIGENLLSLDCVVLTEVLVDELLMLKCEIHYVKSHGGKVFTKDVFLSRAECFSLMKNIQHEISQLENKGRTLMINT